MVQHLIVSIMTQLNTNTVDYPRWTSDSAFYFVKTNLFKLNYSRNHRENR